MKFIVSSTALTSRLSAISRVINSKNTLPILDCFLFSVKDNVLTATASDGENTIVTTVEIAEVEGEGSIAVGARTMLDALKEIPEQPLTFEVDTSTLEVNVEYLNGKYKLVGQNPDEFPRRVELNEDAISIEMDAATLLEGVTRTLFATADDELRPVMNGVYFDLTEDNITLVASDGHKLVRFRSTAAHAKSKAAFILPKKPAGQVKNLLTKELGTVQVGFDNRNAIFVMEGYTMTSRLIDGRYPNYNSVIPKENPCHLTADRQLLLGAMKRVSVFASQASSLVKLNLTRDQILVSAQDYDFSTSANETVVCQYDGNDMSIGFKATFLIDILSNLPGEEVVMELADPSRAGILTPAEQSETDDLLMLLMPMMLSD